MGMTMAEKVLARASGRAGVRPGEYVTARVDVAMCHEAFVLCTLKLMQLGVDRVFDPARVVVILDHYFPAPTEQMARAHSLARDFVERFGIRHFLGHAGICHQVLTERGYARPGELILGTDSHSTTYGAVGAAGAGIGVTEMAYVLATGELWFRVPETIRFVMDGTIGVGVMSKDVALHIAGRFGTDFARRLVSDPQALDVVVLPNLYGDILSDAAAGLVGGLGLAPSGCYGDGYAYFEAVHGTAPDIAGRNVINPTATILSAAMMLDYLGCTAAAQRLEAAVAAVYAEGRMLTPDQGGQATTTQFCEAVTARL